ncbi:ABC transporter permease [Spongiibacter sp.]|uniref:ABC transporter permease n=1 Tax=Spongiibacter sp. TaxID=2024860 RepID=UPI00356A1171
MLVIRQWLRAWRGGELGLLCIALSLAIASVSGIAGFSERLQGAMAAQSQHFLAAERVLASARPVAGEWLQRADKLGLQRGEVAAFRSMVFAGDNMLLVSIRAVSSSYPLLGQLQFAERVFGESAVASQGPSRGSIWLDSRAFALLGIQLGDTVTLGEASFVVSRVLVNEPDRGSALNIYGPRALMHRDDLAATEVVQPGSVVDYRYLFNGDDAQLDVFQRWLEARLLPGQKWLSVEDSQPALAKALQRAEQYLLLAASLAVALAGAAIALAAQRYGQRNVDNVALMKTLGASRRYVLTYYMQQLFLVLVFAAVLGGGCGYVVQQLLLGSVAQLIAVDLPSASWRPLAVALASASVCLISFAMPPIVRLSRVSPLHVLRRQQGLNGGLVTAAASGLCGVALLMLWYSGDLKLTAALAAGFVVLLAGTAMLVLLCLRGLRALSVRLPGSGQRLAASSIYRRRYANAFQAASIALALMVLLSLVLLRELLLKDWQQQVADDTPNYFLINIAAAEVQPLANFLRDRGVEHAGLYPMVRGRLTHIDGRLLASIEELDTRNSGIDREVNLSWSADLPADNRLVAGRWLAEVATPGEVLAVSVEEDLAAKLGLGLGAHLQFNIGGRGLTAEVSSIRQLDWTSMRPNFYFLFPDNSLRDYASSYITSFYLADADKPLLAELLSRYPTISVIEIDAVLRQVQSVVTQLSSAIAVVLLLVLACALLISAANVLLSFDARRQENALLRTLGAGNRFLMWVLLSEFALLGALAGAVAAVGANFGLYWVQRWVLESAPLMYWSVLPISALLGAVLLVILAYWHSRRMLRSSAVTLLRGD